ncbi:MAG: hypothetical protein JWP97_3113 [Labilithrix sp.]|nr:hypothetical protein [Labilithrix sp.]
MNAPPPQEKRCGNCARFVRVVEKIDVTGEVHREGECLLGVWPSPLRAHNVCSQWVLKGTFTAKPQPGVRGRSFGGRALRMLTPTTNDAGPRLPIELPEELLDMNADEFREVLREVLRDELGLSDSPLGQRWEGGEVIFKPGKEGTAEKRLPIDSVFSKIVMIRDKLRVLEQKLNAHPKLAPEEKVAMQGYITGCYGSLTTFNVLFANKSDNFVGAKGDE